jgi:hypothetical protein
LKKLSAAILGLAGGIAHPWAPEAEFFQKIFFLGDGGSLGVQYLYCWLWLNIFFGFFYSSCLFIFLSFI